MVRFVAVVVCLFTLVATAGPAEAQYFGRNKVRYDHLDFRVLKTDHFDIYYYPEEEEATRHAARMAARGTAGRTKYRCCCTSTRSTRCGNRHHASR